MVQMAGAGMLGLGVLQGGTPPRKQRFKDPTGTSPATLGVVRSGHLLFVSGIDGPLRAFGPIEGEPTAAVASPPAL